jgi:photosystem II stability/assembly factor-like uncharacterized protein
MKMKTPFQILRFLLITMLMSIIFLPGYSQKKPVLGNDYSLYTKQMDDFYKTNYKGKGSGYKQYMRWRYLMDTRVGTSGLLRNFDLMNNLELEKYKRKHMDNSRSVHGQWEDLGPTDYYVSDVYSGGGLGRINCMAFHPTNPDIFWAGSPVGGLWKTIDGGLNWQCITNNFASIGISDIAVDYTNPDVIYILTGDDDGADSNCIGILKTTDGGVTWKNTNFALNPIQNIFGRVLALHPSSPNILLVGLVDNSDVGNPTLLYTYDGGDHWVTLMSDITVFDIEFKPGSPNTVYAATQIGVFKSTVAGIPNFIISNSGLPASAFLRSELGVSPSQPENLYVLFGGTDPAGTFKGLYKSTDSGESFELKSNTPNILSNTMSGDGSDNQAGYDLTITVDPADDNKVFVGGINCWKSINGGTSWGRETWWTRNFAESDPYVHADFHCLYFRGSRLYAGNDGGIYYTDNFGHSWTEISKGLGIMQFYDIAIHDGKYMGGSQDNGTNEREIGNMQTHNIAGGDGFGCTWHNTDHSIQFLSTEDNLIRRQAESNLFIKEDFDQFWFTKLKMATDVDHLFAIQSYNELIRGHQNAFPHDWSWYYSGTQYLANGILKNYVQGIDIPNIMYVVSERRLLKTTSIYSLPSVTWDTLPTPDQNLYYTGIDIHPDDAQKIWIVCGDYLDGKKVYSSTDGGMTWTNISCSLPNIPMRCIIFQNTGSGNLYVGTEIGVFYKSLTMSDWVYFGNNLPAVPVFDLKISDGYIYAGTYGRGIWRSDLFSNCETNLTLTPANDTYSPYSPGTQNYTAQNTITTSRIYNGSLGTNIYHSAGQKVEFIEGFWAKDGTFINASTDGCPD